jgi:hypothetical protein
MKNILAFFITTLLLFSSCTKSSDTSKPEQSASSAAKMQQGSTKWWLHLATQQLASQAICYQPVRLKFLISSQTGNVLKRLLTSFLFQLTQFGHTSEISTRNFRYSLELKQSIRRVETAIVSKIILFSYMRAPSAQVFRTDVDRGCYGMDQPMQLQAIT